MPHTITYEDIKSFTTTVTLASSSKEQKSLQVIITYDSREYQVYRQGKLQLATHDLYDAVDAYNKLG